MRTTGLVVCLAAAAAVPSSAGAAVATLSYEAPLPGIEPRPSYSLAVRADERERNLLSVVHDGTAYVVRGNQLTPGAGCTRFAQGAVRCATPRSDASHSDFVNAGDQTDLVGVSALPPDTAVELRGGPGNDSLQGDYRTDDLLLGGDGNDTLMARGGRDTLVGGAGSDEMDGGPGRDRVSYEERTEPVRVDLGAETGGAGNENDRLLGIQDVVGGRAADFLAGDSTPNVLLGGPGRARDRLFGHGGDDALTGYRASGGGGEDSIDAQIGSCDRGTDRLMRISFKTRGPFPRDCERVVAGAFLEITADPVRLTRRLAVYRLRCVAAIGRCAATLELADRRGRLGMKRFSRPDASAARWTRIRIRLRRPARSRVGTVRVLARPAYRRDSFRTRLR